MSLRFAALLVIVPCLIALAIRKPLYGVFGLLFLYYFRPEVWDQPAWWQPVEWLTLATMASWLIHAKGLRIDKGILISALLLSMMCVNSLLAAVSPDTSWGVTETILKLVVMQFICLQVIRDLRTLLIFIWVNTLANLWTLKSALVQTIGGGGEVRVNVGSAQGGGSNYLAMIFVMTLPLLYFRYLNGSKIERRLALIIAPLEIIGCVGTGSRGGYLTLFFTFMFLAIRSGKKLKGFMLTLLFMVVFAVAIPAEKWDRFMGTFTGTGKETATGNSRVGLWKVAIQLFEQSPVVGVGWDNYQLKSPALYGFFAGKSPIPYDPSKEGLPGYTGFVAHSTWFQALADGGLIGALPLFGLFFWSFWVLYRVRKARLPPAEQAEVDQMSQIIEGTLWAFVLASSFASHMKLDFLWYYFGAIGAFSLIVKQKQANQRRIRMAMLEAERQRAFEPAEV